LDDRRNVLRVEGYLVVDRCGDERGRPLHLSLVRIVKEEEEIRVECNTIAAP